MPRLNARQRAEVVELLRCAADNAACETFLPLLTAVDDCEAAQSTRWHAFCVYGATFRDSFDAWPIGVLPEHEREVYALLDGAARVEEGSYP